MTDRTYTVAHFFAGAGGSCNGYSRARVEALGVRARFETVLAVDCWDTALETCRRMNGGPVHLYDLFDAEGYTLAELVIRQHYAIAADDPDGCLALLGRVADEAFAEGLGWRPPVETNWRTMAGVSPAVLRQRMHADPALREQITTDLDAERQAQIEQHGEQVSLFGDAK